ncbi:OHCU decarboxylase [Catenulispora acidiphila DSM 44928]|uniref:2-oxo-4-hydroxy-4-carboxy-5-ureidoimidazoline decarboxylase n=1 Tax=Catenulispora acidiphila (strain DSM 44928 / JCM 14897 / NBRC 102108 / NRRL B-24433 / ID139908) TaxID=479433 RepID=C7PZT5_CATAD|nr:2-oxo-4-hydroxy-4-carboxy-5-ureidoimidazoline decarboxylase [Catenulispora acidiphila]ACU73600.1 OHCU decarboxylase [Catenulispora acidiphila DSM 44928]
MPEDARREAVAALNAWSAEQATQELSACCASRRWTAAVADGRPYGGWAELASAATAGIKALRWSDVLEALDAHPRIGDRAAGQSREAAWSRAEQSAAAGSAESVRQEVTRANAEYEQAFGHVFLIRAAGRSAEEILAEARRRLGNDAAAEQREVRAELAQIVLLRLERLAEAAAAAEPAAAPAPAAAESAAAATAASTAPATATPASAAPAAVTAAPAPAPEPGTPIGAAG